MKTSFEIEAEGLFESFFKRKPASIASLDKGYSNAIFLLEGKYIVRIKKDSDSLFYNPHKENSIIKSIEGLRISPVCLFFDESTGNKIEEFEETERDFLSQGHVEEDLLSLVPLLKKLHGANPSANPFGLFERLQKYKEAAQEVIEQDYEAALSKAVAQINVESPSVLSHNDLCNGNILMTKQGPRLCDFEFAGANSPYFDIASIFGENSIEDQSLLKKFLQAYFGEGYQDDDLTKANIINSFSHLLWYYWAKARYKKTGLDSFLSIAKEKQRLLIASKKLFSY